MSLCRYDTSKPCNNKGTSSRTCLDCVLNKIRAEIDAKFDDRPSNYNHAQRREFYSDVLSIIDKYRKEQK